MTAAAPPFRVRKLDISFADLRRGGEARLRIYLPDTAGPVPCAVVSHGFGSSRLGYAFLGRHLASQGIAAVHVAHGAHEARILARGAEGRAEFLLALEDRERIRARTGDVIAAIDALEGGLLGKLPCEIDAARLAFVGQCECTGQRAVAGEGAHFEASSGTNELHEEGHQLALLG